MSLLRINLYGMKWLTFLAIICVSFLITACDKDAEDNFTAEFNYEFIDDNNVQFVNISSGEYYSFAWNFGIGETTTSSTDKNKIYQVYYPEKGEYEAKLSVLNYSGVVKTSSKIISISKTDLLISFSAEIDASNPNYVILKNTTEGEYDSFKWFCQNKEIYVENSATIYFPFEGLYNIELHVTKGDNSFIKEESVIIAQDDPDYISTFTLSWADEFEGPEISSDNWTFETGANGWGNNELQNYTNGDNVKIEDGILKITVEKENNLTALGSYSSTRIVTKGKKEFTYGRMEIRAKLPEGRGIWPAIWMLGTNINSIGWPACGEIDILEYVGYDANTIHATVHTTSGSGANGDGNSKTLNTAEEEFHIYGVVWTEKEMVFYVDKIDNVTHTYAPSSKNDDNWPFYQPQFFILNVAVGGNWGGAQGIDNSIFPQTMEIDYVRVYQPKD